MIVRTEVAAILTMAAACATLPGCQKRTFNSVVKEDASQEARTCEIGIAIAPNVFDYSAMVGKFKDQDILNPSDIPESIRTQILVQFERSLFWSTDVLFQQGNLGPTSDTTGGTPAFVMGNSANAPLVLQHIVIPNPGEAQKASELILSFEGGRANLDGKSKFDSETPIPPNTIMYRGEGQHLKVSYHFATNPNVEFECDGKKHRFKDSRTFPGLVLGGLEVTRNEQLRGRLKLDAGTALDLAGVPLPEPMAALVNSVVKVGVDFQGSKENPEPRATALEYRGKSGKGLSRYEYELATDVLQPLCSAALDEIDKKELGSLCKVFMPGVSDPVADLQMALDPKRAGRVFPIASCNPIGPRGLHDYYALTAVFPPDYEPNSQQVVNGSVTFGLFGRVPTNNAPFTWKSQGTWTTLKTVPTSQACPKEGEFGPGRKCGIVELGQLRVVAAIQNKFRCMCERIGNGTKASSASGCRGPKKRASRAEDDIELQFGMGLDASIGVAESRAPFVYQTGEDVVSPGEL
jgi:hypothetical protein